MSIDTIENRDIIMFSIQNWDSELGGNKPRKNIAAQLAKKNRVLFVNTPVDRISALKSDKNLTTRKRMEVLDGKAPSLQKVADNIWNYYPETMIESINWIKVGPLFDMLNQANNKKFAEEIKKATNKLGFKNVIIMNDNEIFRGYYLKEYLKPDLYIYYIRDFLTAVDYWKFHGKRLEPKLIEKADMVVANSTYYTDYAKQFNQNSFYVGQGCEVDKFNEALVKEVPEDIKNIKRPIIGYVGALYKLRLDTEILIHIAEQRPDWNVVLVGPEDDHFKTSRLHEMPNVRFLGLKEIGQLPAYIKYFDVCLNPQVVNPVTIGNYPLKIDEYLAMGKPVVATVTKAMEVFEDYTYLARNKEEYVPLIEKAMAEHSPEKAEARKKYVAGHTWENTVKAICKAINTVSQSRKIKLEKEVAA
jgi:teichuronic acid biosynthesis glycosyltransferase TuaH